MINRTPHTLRTRTFIMFLTLVQVFSLSGQSELGMHLGDLAFVKAKTSITLEQRSLNMKMATTGISPDFYSKVGGVAFVQTAIPEFDIKSISCDVIDSISYIIINGNSYEIPLENWMLKPIVAYANSDNNAAVTLYGGIEVRLKYHPAFIDNLVGLRLLQTDMLLTSSNLLSRTDKAKIPTFDTGREILTRKESNSIGGRKQSSVSEYEKKSLYSIDLIDSVIIDKNEAFNTYIYTDYKEPISFSANSTIGITFKGSPYYRFAQIMVDTLEAVKYLNSFLDSMEVRKDLYIKYDDNILKEFFSDIPTLKAILLDEDDAKQLFELLNYSEDSNRYFEVLLSNLTNIAEIDQTYVEQNRNELRDEDKKCIELMKKGDPYLAPLILGMRCDMYNSIQDETSKESNFFSSYIKQLKPIVTSQMLIGIMNWHIWKKTPYVVSEAQETIEFFKNKEGRDIIRDINPLIIDESECICQWSALFRYVKKSNPENWADYVEKINLLNDNIPNNMPNIWTPINIVPKNILDWFQNTSSLTTPF